LDRDRRYFAPDIELLPRAELDALQESKLFGDLLPWAYGRSQLIRQTWDAAGVTPDMITSRDEFRAHVPFIDKDAIRRFRRDHGDPYGGLLCVDLHTPGVFSAVFSTSGTTGEPTPAPYAGRGPSMLTREFWELGARPGDHFTYALFTFRGPGIHDTIRGIGATPVFFDHRAADVPQLVRLSRELRPTGWYSLSGPLILALEDHAASTGARLEDAFSSYRGVVYAGEPLGARARRVVEDWGVELFVQTALGDVGAATECREHNGCHFWEDTAFVEVLDPDGTEPVPDGARGELVSTTLVDKIAPLVRYRSDDLVRVSRDPCACGRTHARVWPLGRKGDEVLVEGRSILPVELFPPIESVAETQAALFQVIRPARHVDRLRLRVGWSGRGDRAAVARRVSDAVASALGVEPHVELVEHDALLRQGPPHKIPRVVPR
jgi:phenylacetate-CoA ligase